MTDQTLTGFILGAASRRAEEVIARTPSEFFDALLGALEEPPAPNVALQHAARQLERLVEQR